MTESTPTKRNPKQHGGAAAAVLDYFLGNADRSIGINELVQNLDYPSKPIRNAISYLHTNKGFNIKTEMLGKRWKYLSEKTVPPGPKTGPGKKDLLEVLAVTRNGTVLVEAEDGAIFKLVEL